MVQTSPTIAVMKWARAWLKKSLRFFTMEDRYLWVSVFLLVCVQDNNGNTLDFTFDCCIAGWKDYVAVYNQRHPHIKG